MKVNPLVNQKFLLQKIPGKGGWTYAALPAVITNNGLPFGWIKVKGTIDGVPINKYHLMPYGDGKLFLPVKAEIRKKIKKEAGDQVHVILYPDDEPIEVPPEILLCLRDAPKALQFFDLLSENEKLNYIKWIYSAKQPETREERIGKTIDRLERKLKFYDSDGRKTGR